MKIIHTGDLHLDSVMESHFDPDTADKRRRELLDTFRRMTEYAAEKKVRLMLIAGDLFDTPCPSPENEAYVFSVMAEHPEIDFLCLSGNHAGDYVPTNPPENYRTFPKNGFGTYSYDGVTVIGSESNAVYATLPPKTDNSYRIVMLHGALTDSVSDLSGINLKLYRGRGIDYLALGHYHAYRMEALDEGGIFCYAGTPEGRGFDETGDKGFVLIDTDAGQKPVFIPFAKRRIHQVTVDISRLFSQREIERQVEQGLSDIPSGDIVRVVLRGYCEADMPKDVKKIETALDGRFFFSYVQDESNLSLHPENYSHDLSLRGEFVRTVLASGLAPEDAERVIQCGLRALSGEEVGE